MTSADRVTLRQILGSGLPQRHSRSTQPGEMRPLHHGRAMTSFLGGHSSPHQDYKQISPFKECLEQNPDKDYLVTSPDQD
jgi:hypothetical protein